jgi:hypothetical protein
MVRQPLKRATDKPSVTGAIRSSRLGPDLIHFFGNWLDPAPFPIHSFCPRYLSGIRLLP